MLVGYIRNYVRLSTYKFRLEGEVMAQTPMQSNPPYPVQFSVDYPDRDLDRFSSFFRIFASIPIAIVIGLLSQGFGFSFYSAGAIMILFRQKYPRWWFDWNLQLERFNNRVFCYLVLLRDEYPSTDEEQAVHLNFPYPNVEQDLNRWLPLIKWILVIPHYIILIFLFTAVFFVAIIAWFAILFTGRYPRGLFDFVVGVIRWANRVLGYAFLLITDEYPPFRLGE